MWMKFFFTVFMLLKVPETILCKPRVTDVRMQILLWMYAITIRHPLSAVGLFLIKPNEIKLIVRATSKDKYHMFDIFNYFVQ